jgi:molybdopterin-guanine dinucleotide biosynthesis protein A
VLEAAAAVLAGGQSSRFGRDKALVVFDGEPLIARLCRELRAQFPAVALVTKSIDAYAAIVPSEVARVVDVSAESTPLAGLEAALEWSPFDAIFLLGCDMPFGASPDVVSRLHERLADAGAVSFTWRGHPEPLCAFYRRTSCLPAARALRAQGRGLRQVLHGAGAAFVRYEEAFPTDAEGLPFQDLDTPEDLQRLRRGSGRRP